MTRAELSECLAILFAAYPDRAPKGTDREKMAIMGVWEKAFSDMAYHDLKAGVSRFALEGPNLYPGQNIIKMLREWCRPVATETSGDVIELADEAVSRFGYMREGDALKWVGSRSVLCAAAIKRFGFLNYCMSENADVSRGQLKAIFLEEKARAEKMGGVVRSATMLENKSFAELADSVAKNMKQLPNAANPR